VAVTAFPLSVSATSFTDGFEGTTLDPFWTTLQNSGSITFPSTAQVHSGSQAVQFNSTFGTGQKNIELNHTFATPQFGEVSVWLFDTGADLWSGNYLGLRIKNTALGVGASLFTNDFDHGRQNGGNYYFNVFDGSGGVTPIDRTQAWHEFAISSTPSALRLSVDGQTVFSGPGGTPFDFVAFDMHGPDWRPAFVSYFDDFSFTAIPEPTSTAIATGIGLLAFGAYRRFSAR
jgi:hypothetical protein